jgi:alpha-L-fucosidase 2
MILFKKITGSVFFIVITVAGFLTFSCSEKNADEEFNHSLWYTFPAEYWNSQALHLGNGYFGVSFFGGIDEETFALSEKSMWTGRPAEGNWEKAGVNPKALGSLQEIRDVVVKGESQRADRLIEENIFGSSEYYGHFTSIGDLNIKFIDHKGDLENYRRELDLKNALGTVEYTMNGYVFRREYFCSYPDRIMGIKFITDAPEGISFNISADIMQDSSIIQVTGNTFHVRGFIDGNSRPFTVVLHVRNKDGSVNAESGRLVVKKAGEVELYLTMATDYKMEYPTYRGEDPDFVTADVVDKVIGKTWEQLKNAHTKDYQTLYNRVSIDLPGDPEAESLPTNERFQRLRSGMKDPGYKELAFNLGRYMIISSSRPNTLPANLQGVWNAFKVAPWSGNYQSNINLQEIYWSCGPSNLFECQEPYIEWIDNLAISGREIARRVYGTEGWVSHTTGNIWGHAAPWGSHPWGMYPMGAAWHCQHIWDHYLFTQDYGYLQEQGYPLLRDASIFWLQNLIPFEGYLITAPSISAEHGALMTEEGLNPAFHDRRSDRYHYSLPGIYQDMQMLWDLFTNTSEAARIIGDNSFSDSLLTTREKLLPLQIGKHGQLQEWYWDIDDPEGHHRHIAHLYAVCPGSQIHPTTTPLLAEAAKKSLNMRGDGRFLEQELASGGNWARAHRMWCWTRLMDGNRANKILTEMLTEQGFENGLTFQHADYHWNREDFYMEDGLYLHYQLDGSASVPGCITEMLLQSHMEEIQLLPALPDEFHTGKLNGIRARGGFTLDLEWKDMELVKARIICPKGKEVPPVRLGMDLISLEDHPEIRIVYQ